MANIEIDGKSFNVENGKMIIEVADEAGIYIPRFCYHKKLSVAANCRMCLVEVENGRKPVPACATPITDGMKVFTKSEEAIHSQKAVMEFLLINHPLDCPICDQGGECELQDLSMGFGYDESEYSEEKRAVVDDNLGSLISTEMTRCIHCTRCVRFGEEIAGVRELGSIGRGEKTRISTYVQHSLTSEVSGNIIDLCPVGALTSKPARFTARPWELSQHNSIAPHDCLGSNVHLHVRRNSLIRVVPRENESINETWLSDRDRFSYLGLSSPDRCSQPEIKMDGQWQKTDWPTALKFAAEGISRVIKQHGPEQFAAFASSSSTLEEFYLLQKLMREMDVNNLDHRLQQTDFTDQDNLNVSSKNKLMFAEIEKQQHVLIFGCNIHRELPLAGVRVRRANQNGAKIYSINAVDYDFHFDVAAKNICSPQEFATELAKIIVALTATSNALPVELQRLLIGIEASEEAKLMANALKQQNAVIISGAICANHPNASLLRTLLHHIEEYSQATVIQLSSGANAAGAAIAGMVPNRGPAGKTLNKIGLDAQSAIEKNLKGYFLLNVEPGFDLANPYQARQAMLGAEFVVMVSPFVNDSIRDYVDVILPQAPFTETSGTYINIDAIWQTVKGACAPFGESRPAWKILRVLGNLLQLNDFDYESSEDILLEIRNLYNLHTPIHYTPHYPEALPASNQHLVRLGEWPLYRSDSIVRNAGALQVCAAAEVACIKIHPDTANRLKLNDIATISQGDIEITLPLKRDERVALDVVWVANALPETADLGHSFASINIMR